MMRTDRKSKVKWSVIILFIFAVLVANFCVLYLHVRDNAISGRKQEIMRSAIEFNNFLVESIDAVKLTSQTIEDMNRSGATSKQILEYLESSSIIYGKTINRSFTGFYGYIGDVYLDGIGWVPGDDFVPTERPWYKEAQKANGEIAFVSPYVDLQTGSVTMSVSRMLSNQKDVISIDLSLDILQRILEESTIRNGWKYGMILDKDNNVVAHSEIEEIGKSYSNKNSLIGYDIVQAISKNDKLGVVKIDGKRYITLTAEVGDTWKLVSVISIAEVLGSTRSILFWFVSSLVIIFIIAVRLIFNIKKRQEKESYVYNQLRALTKVYDIIFLIDIVNDRFYEFIEKQTDSGILVDNENKRAQYNLRMLMDALTDRRYKKSIYDFINLSTINKRLKDKNVISKTFINNNNQKFGVKFTPVESDEKGNFTKVIFMIENMYDN